MKTRYTVWVGGGEINDYNIETLEEAKRISGYWVSLGYDDVIIEQITIDNK